MLDNHDDGISHGRSRVGATPQWALDRQRKSRNRKICRRVVVALTILGVIALVWALS